VIAAEGSIEARLAAAGLPPVPRFAWLEIDLGALVGNLAALRSLAGDVPVYPVVKGDAYGHGAIPVSQALAEAGVDGLSVATMDEALELRAAGLGLPIRVLYPIPAAMAGDAMREGITVAAGDADTAEALLVAAATDVETERELLVEIEVETGLGRGGTLPSDVPALVERIAGAPRARLVGLWTHLQASEDGGITGDQLRRFDEAAEALVSAGRELPRRHVAASGGVIRGVGGFDGIRPGLSIYGILPDELAGAPAVAPTMRPVMSLHARPVRIADLPAGYGISYGPSFRTARPSRIATLPLGYGDGFARANANRSHALVRGGRVPLVGNVTMDAVMADVTDVPGPPVGLADEFVLLGAQGDERITVEELAQQRTTNTWEVVTSMSARLPRVYHAATGAVVGIRTLVGWRG
jgi:alanine racemase